MTLMRRQKPVFWAMVLVIAVQWPCAGQRDHNQVVLSNGIVDIQDAHYSIAGTLGQASIGAAIAVDRGIKEGFWYLVGLERVLTLDIDGDGTVDPTIDGLLILRYLFGFTGASLTENINIDTERCIRCNSESLVTRLNFHKANGVFDVDENGRADALTDGLLILRRLSGIIGTALIANAVAPDCQNCAIDEIEIRLTQLIR